MRLHLSLMTVLLATLLAPASAHAYTLGAADGTTTGAHAAAQLGARTYRIVMDPAIPLDQYAPRVETYRAAGMRPQIVVGGTGTSVRGTTTRQGQWITAYAVAAFKRWPDAYSVSVVNEPNLSGTSACNYSKTFRRAYRSLKAAGVPRVLFGEWSPGQPVQWTNAAIGCSSKPITADGWAWHCYDAGPEWYGVTYAYSTHRWLQSKRLRAHLRNRKGGGLALYCTEYGQQTRGVNAVSETVAALRWSRALGLARKYMAEIVVWGIHEAPTGAKWDSSLTDSNGRPRPAFGMIAAAAR